MATDVALRIELQNDLLGTHVPLAIFVLKSGKSVYFFVTCRSIKCIHPVVGGVVRVFLNAHQSFFCIDTLNISFPIHIKLGDFFKFTSCLIV